MDQIKVGLIYGGQSPEHEVSKMTAESIRGNIDREKFEVVDIFIDQNGKFDENLLNDIDVAFLAVHGPNCEDGRLQQYLEDHNIKYTGSGVEASRINMDKYLMHKVFAENDLSVVEFEDFNKNDINLAQDFVQKIGLPVFVKPNNGGSSIGFSKVTNQDELKDAISRAFEYDDRITIEKAITNPREIELAIMGNNDLAVSKPGEILTQGEFYSYENKYNNPFETTVNAELSPEQTKNFQDLAEKAYLATGCRGYARVDFLMDQNGEIYLNEINTLPGFTKISMFPKLMAAIGIPYKDLITKIIELALE